jgi:hypothetical protein
MNAHLMKKLSVKIALAVMGRRKEYLENGVVIPSRFTEGPSELRPSLAAVSHADYVKITRVAGKLKPSTNVTVVTGERRSLRLCARVLI